MTTIEIIILSIGAYLLCSFSFAVLISRLFRFKDPRFFGSENPGATNVLRLGNKKAAALVLFADGVKGIIPILIAQYCGLSLFAQGVIAFFAVLGHIYPIYYSFKGGKGVATTLGVLLALNIPLGLSSLCTWLIFACVFRFSSLASIVMALSLPVYVFMLNLFPLLPTSLLVAGFLLFRHRSNLRNLLMGKEPKIGEKVG